MLFVIEEKTKMVTLKSGANIELDTFGNVWYKSDLDIVLGKVVNDKFIPLNNKEFNTDMLSAIAKVIDKQNVVDDIRK
jgi:hypothetical protein